MNEVDPVHAMRTTMRRYAAADADLSFRALFRCGWKSLPQLCFSVLVTLAFARLQHLFRRTLEGDRSPVADRDIAVVSHFTRPQRQCRPRTAVEG